MIDPDFERARLHTIRHCVLPPTCTPTADVLDGELDATAYVMGPLSAIKLGRDLAKAQALAIAESRLSICYQRVDGRGILDARQTRNEIAAMMPTPPAYAGHRRETEHWSTEQVKRAVIAAIVEHSKTGGMAVAARRAADQIIHLLRPAEEHREMEPV